MRLSTLFLRTLRDDPADAEIPSHKLLVRAGYIRRVGPGSYTWLPLGIAVVRNIERVVREEITAIGGQEVQFPSLLGPTHEELFGLLVRGEYSSYRDYPLILFQIQTEYRDEPRPRAGILRGREFTVKDSYSFDVSDDGLAAAYRAHRDAYERIFTRLGFDYRIVFALSGAMGGSASEEFVAPTPSGEDAFIHCDDCEYAANAEAAEIAVPLPSQPEAHPASRVLDTPDTPTIETLVDRLNTLGLGRTFTGADTLKNVVLKTRAPGADVWELLVVGVPGDREVDLKRLAGQLEPVEVAQADAADLALSPRLVRGYIGPQVLRELGVRYVVDPLVAPGSAWITGANEVDRHAAFVVRGRDFEPDDEMGAVEIRAGDRCARCASALRVSRGIELGHVFQLGRKFADAFGLHALGPEGTPLTIAMGSYGLGITRAVAALAEQTHDEKGLCWPRSVAPADVHVVATGRDDAPFEAAERVVADLVANGTQVLFDDRRGISPGVKFADAELLGIPTIVIVGRGVADGVVEVRDRRSGERRDVPLDAVAAAVR